MATFVPRVKEFTPPTGQYGTHFFQAAVYLGTKEIWSSKIAHRCQADADRDASDIAEIFNAQASTGGGTQLRL